MNLTDTPTDNIHLTFDTNIHRLTDTLWTGGDLPSERCAAIARLNAWRDLGIRRIIDCRIEWSDEELIAEFAPEITYLHAGIDDAGQTIPDEWFDQITTFAADTADQGALLAHCHMGINRGPSCAYAILLSQGEDPIDAIGHIRSRRHIAAISYAEDALGWWHRRIGATAEQRADDIARLAQWRADSPHATARIIRQIRASHN